MPEYADPEQLLEVGERGSDALHQVGQSASTLLGLDDTDLLLAQAGNVSIDIEVDGEPYDPALRKVCPHGGVINVQTVAAIIREGDGSDLTKPIIGWQVRLRARCGECGQTFEVDPTSARPPRDNPRGCVLDMRPSDN